MLLSYFVTLRKTRNAILWMSVVAWIYLFYMNQLFQNISSHGCNLRPFSPFGLPQLGWYPGVPRQTFSRIFHGLWNWISLWGRNLAFFFFFNRSYSICCLIFKKFLLWSSKIIHKTRETLQQTLICPPPSFDGYLQSANVVLLTPQQRMCVRMCTCVHWSILRKSLDVISFFS